MKKADVIFVRFLKALSFSFRVFGILRVQSVKRYSVFFFYTILLINLSDLSAQNISTVNRPWTYTDPFNTDVFIENYGQFNNWTTGSGEILYAINKKEKIFFSQQGLTFRVDKIVWDEAEENEFSDGPASNTGREEEEHPTGIQYAVHMNWLGSNPDAEIMVSKPTANYYTFGENGYENIRAKAYKTLLYKNLYDGIDVEYTIPEKGGIKYKFIVHPGADISKVKIVYSGDVLGINLDSEGNIVINTPAGDIIDHAPFSYYDISETPVASYFSLEENTIQINVPDGYDNQKTLIVDPWTVTPSSLSTDYSAFDMAYDDAGNVYVSGGTVPRKLAKYSAAGVLLWTYTYPADWGDASYGYYGRFCILPSSGSTIIGEGWNNGGPRVMKVNSAGSLIYMMPNLSGNQEIWVMFYNRCAGKLVGFGGGTQNANNMQVIADTNLTSSVCSNFNSNTSVDNDVAAAEEDYNGDFYALMSSIVAGSKNGYLMKSLSSSNYTAPAVWEVSAGYNSAECYNYGIPGLNSANGVTVRANALALNDNYLFSYDGNNLKAWDKTNGTLLGSTVVNGAYADGQNRTHEGIAVDDCNNVYVGGTNLIHVFNFNGSAFSTAGAIPMSNEVYDVRLDRISGTLYACGYGFVSSTPATAVCNTSQLTLNASPTPGVCDGSASVTVSGGTQPYTYIWSNGSTTNSISGVSAGWYYVTVTDNSCIRLRGVDSVLITTSFPTTLSNDTSVCSGVQVPLQATGGTTYTWSPAGSLSNANISNPLASPSSTTTYYVTISDGACNKTDSVTVTINISPTLTVSNVSICNGQPDTLFASGASSYLWNTGDNNSFIVVNPAATTTYTVTGTTAGCTGTGSGIVTVNGLPNPQITPFNHATCGFNNGNATASGGSTYLWSNGQSTATISGLSAGVYTVTVSSGAGCSATTSVTINNIAPPVASATATNENCGHANGTASATVTDGTAPFSFAWSNSQFNQNIINLPANTYTVTVTDADGCTSVASATVSNIAGPSLQILNIVNDVCTYGNGSATVNAVGGVPPYTYLWSSGDNTATAVNLYSGSYTCTVTDSNNCTAFNTALITDTPGPLIAQGGVTFASCGMADGGASLNVSSGLPPYNFAWNTSPQQFTQNLQNVPTGNYCVTVTDANSCSATTCINVGENSGPSATASSVNEICDQSNGSATANPSGGLGIYYFLWSDGQTTQTATGLTQGTYTVTVSDAGCSTVVSVNVLETPGPDAGFSAHPPILTLMDGPVSFLDNSSGNIVSWNWSFGDGSSGSGPDPEHPYLNIGTYPVVLIVTDNNGCLDTTVDTIKVKDIFTLYIPNAFTPNADGFNDFFAPMGISIDPDDFEMYIFDRWGNMMFNTTLWDATLHRSEQWNGTKDNKGTYNDVVMDVYVYRIKVKEIDGPKHEYIGRISLIP